MRCLLLLIPTLLLAAQTPGTTSGSNVPSRKTATAAKNYKESGSPDAPLTIEIYTDYECPHCRLAYETWVPQLVNEYVKTGKAKLIHRDFPLPMHQYARVAALFANAAGELGYYDIVSEQIFKTQPDWTQNGNIDGQVAKVVPPGVMQQIRERVKSDPKLEESIKADVAMGNADRLGETPMMVVVRNGNRQSIAPIPPFPVLKTYLDQQLAKR